MRQIPSLFILLLIGSCTTTSEKRLVRPTHDQYIFTAWNEDTTHSVKFLPLKNNRFVYQIKNKKEKTVYFVGTYQDKIDTILLTFENPQSDWKNFLIKEISNNYLIQQFVDDRKSIFLRIHRPLQR